MKPRSASGKYIVFGDLADGFYLEDDGSGILNGERGQVFEAVYSSREQGADLGVAGAEQLAKAHDWEIRGTESADCGA